MIKDVETVASRAAGTETMDQGEHNFEFRVGDHVTLIDDDWSLVGHDIVLVDIEPVPGSTQCVVRDGTETRFVSRVDLRRAL